MDTASIDISSLSLLFQGTPVTRMSRAVYNDLALSNSLDDMSEPERNKALLNILKNKLSLLRPVLTTGHFRPPSGW
jgi:hypothetical protein